MIERKTNAILSVYHEWYCNGIGFCIGAIFVMMIFDIFKGWNIVSLRYFNPIGAHKSGSIGEDPKVSQKSYVIRPRLGARF